MLLSVVTVTTVFPQEATAQTSVPDDQAKIEGESQTYDTIQNAIDNASAGDTILVGAGTFNQSVTVNVDNLTLEGPNAGLSGNSDTRGAEATITDANGRLVIDAPNVEIDGFNFEFDESAIQSKSGNDNLITNSRFELTGSTSDTYAVRVGGGSPGTDVTNNLFTDVVSNDGTGGDNVNGVVVTDPRDTRVANNRFSRVDTAVTVGDQRPEAGALVVENNEFSDITQFGAVALANGDAGLDVDVNSNTIESSRIGVGVFAGNSSATFSVKENKFRSFADDTAYVDDRVGVLSLGDVRADNAFDTDVLTNSAKLRPSPITSITITNPSDAQIDLSVTTTLDLDVNTANELNVGLGAPVRDTGGANDVLETGQSDFSEQNNTDGTFTYTASVEADISPGSTERYQAVVSSVNGISNSNSRISSQSIDVSVATTDTSNSAPIAVFTPPPFPDQANAGEVVIFRASASSDPDGSIIKYEWDFDGSGAFDDATGASAPHTFPTGGNKTVQLRVTDNDGATSITTRTVLVNAPPTPEFTISSREPAADEPVTLNASETSDTDGTVQTFGWDLDGDGITDRTGETITSRFPNSGEQEVTLRVTDNDGATSTTTETISVEDLSANPFPRGIPGVSEQPPRDLNENGLYEDVNGDGTADFSDAVTLAFADFDAINSGSQAQIDALDFNSDGTVDFNDAVALSFNI